MYKNKNFKYIVVGAGLTGLVIAERIANVLNEKVLIIEKKNHIGVVKFGEHSVPSDDPFEWGEAYGFFIDGEVLTPAISKYGHYHDYDLEVIGNIHDNPELLKGSEEE